MPLRGGLGFSQQCPKPVPSRAKLILIAPGFGDVVEVGERFRNLAGSAIRNGKEDDFIPVALQWAEGATSEIARMRSEITESLAILDNIVAAGYAANRFQEARDRLRALL